MIREFSNKIEIAGRLIKNNLEFGKTKAGDECIKGDLVVKTEDGSEHSVQLFSKKYKKDTTDITYFYNKYSELIPLKDLSKIEADIPKESAIYMLPILKINGNINSSVFATDDGKVMTSNKLQGRFINVVEDAKKDSVKMNSKFEFEGIIDKIEEVYNNDVPDGLSISFNVVTTKTSDNKVFELDKMFPITLKIDQSMAKAFLEAGYFKGGFTKFHGDIVNKIVVEEIVEKAGFGEDIIKTITKTFKSYLVKGATKCTTIYDVGLKDADIDALKAKREQEIQASKNGGNNANATSSDGFAPFGANIPNPFEQIQ